MAGTIYRCDECDVPLKFRNSPTKGTRIRCPHCGEITYYGQPIRAVTRKIPESSARARAVREREPTEVAPRARRRRRREKEASLPKWVIPVAIGVVVLIVGGVLAFVLIPSSKKDTQVANNTPKPGPSIPTPPGPTPPFPQPPGPTPPGPGPTGPKTTEPPRGGPGDPSTFEPTQPISIPTTTGKPLLVLDPEGHTSSVKDMAFTPDGKYLLTASTDKTIRVVDVVTGRTERVIRLPIGPGSEGSIYAMALTPDGKTLAVGGVPVGSGKHGILVHIVDVESGEVLRVLKGHNQVITTLHFSPNGKWLASGSHSGGIMIQDVTTGALVQKLPGHDERVQEVRFHPNGRILASCSYDKTVRLWFLEEKQVQKMNRHTQKVNALAWSHDGKILASGGSDGIIRVWSSEGKWIGDMYGAPVGRNPAKKEYAEIISLLFTRDDRELIYTGVAYTGELGIVDVKTGKRRAKLLHHDNTVQSAALSRDGTLAASSGGNNDDTFIWRVIDGEVVHKIAGKGNSVMGIGWHPNGTQLVWGNTNKGDTIRGRTPLEHGFDLQSLEFEPLDRRTPYHRAIVRDGDDTLEKIDHFRIAYKNKGKTYHVFKSPLGQERIYSVSYFGKDRVIIGGSDGLYLTDRRTGRVVRRFEGHTGITWAVAPHPSGRYFATGSTDQTMAIWDPNKKEPVMRLFFAGRSWICWAPEGYYAASPYGERLMGWQTNNGIDAAASYYPAMQFRDSLYHPKVLQGLLKAGSLRQALVQAGVNAEGNVLDVQSVLPPRVAVVAPASKGRVKLDQGTFQVKAVAKSVGRHPVTSLRLLVDGRPYLGRRGIVPIPNPKLGQVGVVWDVDLEPGEHSVAVQAESAVSKGLSPVVDVVCAGEVRKPNLYVLAYGISEYPEKEMKLDFAASDAELLSETLKKRASKLFDTIEVKLVKDGSATKQGIGEGLEWMKERMTTNDVAVIFFSGHGTREENGDFFMVPVDARVESIRGTCFSGDVFKQALEDLPGRVVAMLDCCHSGAVAEKAALRSRVADDLVRDLVTDEYGVIVMCSSLGREYSLESPDTKAGFFTRGLVEGMKGEADLNRDSLVHLHELNFFAALFVKTISGGRQNPVVGLPRHAKSFPIASR